MSDAGGLALPRGPAVPGGVILPGAVKLLDEDPDLGDQLPDAQRAAATRDARARAMLVLPGEWVQPSWPESVLRGPGLLVLSGLLMRRVGLAKRYGAELLGSGDLLRPWQREDATSSMPREAGWQVLRRSRLAVLDVEFLRRTYPYPELTGQLVSRALRRSRHLAVNMAIVHQPRVETRVHMLLWHLADRWGTVGPAGVNVPIRLTHTMIADLVAAQRPTVTAALSSLERNGVIGRTASGWRLRGNQPLELADVSPPAG